MKTHFLDLNGFKTSVFCVDYWYICIYTSGFIYLVEDEVTHTRMYLCLRDRNGQRLYRDKPLYLSFTDVRISLSLIDDLVAKKEIDMN